MVVVGAWPLVRTTQYFQTTVLPKRPYLRIDLCRRVIQHHERQEVQPDGRVRSWAWVPEDGHYWRVVTEADGTLHSAFRDSGYRGAQQP
jgi:hypothetical protein